MKIFIISILLALIVWVTIPVLWKSMGGSFIHGNTVVYKGKQLFKPNNNCSIAVVGEDFEEVKQVCLSNEKTVIRTWINGVEAVNDVTL